MPHTQKDYLEAASLLERLNRDECHPDLWPERQELACTLRRMAFRPGVPQHAAVLRSLRFLVYVPMEALDPFRDGRHTAEVPDPPR